MDIGDLVNHSMLRRCWLLSKAAECGDFAQAIAMARAAEDFVVGRSGDAGTKAPAPLRDGASREVNFTATSEGTRSAPVPTLVDGAPVVLTMPPPVAVPEESHAATSDASARKADAAGNISRLPIPADRRDELLDRLAEGARNHELASLFGVSAKQIQGIRMGAAREIAKRRSRIRKPDADEDGDIEATVDDVVRYLRQQDDVVVRQEDGTYLVNGRFRLDAAELVAKANRMLVRQHKPAFKAVNLGCELRMHSTAGSVRVNGHR